MALLQVFFFGHGAAAHPRSPACESAEAYVLGNGVEVRLRVDHALPAVAVVSSVHAGSRHDPRGHEGLAHYVEHLTFRSSSPFASVDELDGLVGALARNAITSLDTTDFFSVVPPEQLELALWIEARRLAIGLDAVEAQQALDERKVLLREQILRFGEGSELTRGEALAQAIFPEGHPYRKASQSVESLDRLSLGSARWFFARHYRPDRVRLVILGDFQPDQAKAVLERLFGTLQARTAGAMSDPGDADPAEECRLAARPNVPPPRRVVVATPERRERLVFTWPVPFGEDGAEALGRLSLIGSEVRLAGRGTGLADRVVARLEPRELGSLWSLEIEPIPGRSFEQLASVARTVLTRLAQAVPDGDQLVTGRQAAELEDAVTERALLSRALTLARRECRPSVCVSPASTFAPQPLARGNRFDPRKATIIESRYRQFAPPKGEVESVPIESAHAP